MTHAQKERIRELVTEILKPDPYGHQGVYRVTSLYYDTPGLEAYWEKVDGVASRRKYRLRYYGPFEAADTFFMEIKGREDRVVLKQRARLKAEAARRKLADLEPLTGLTGQVLDHLDTAEAIELEAYRKQLRPTAVISYLREAWIGILESRLRLTFDQFCQGAPPGSFAFGEASALHAPSQSIMEVKFDHQIPRWLSDRITEVEAQPVRFSKYANAVEMLGQ
ncbi:MAG: polyphosphate polymerase domain-containing protein [Candidatus Eremiobacteraeota bacterium]|nr:polyphosphate polymerase domain-containing protein [Candidatus Eremiobacteraeota bacterium]